MCHSALLYLILLLFISSCARLPIKNRHEAMRAYTENPHHLFDHLMESTETVDSLRQSVSEQLEHWSVQEKNNLLEKDMIFGPTTISTEEYRSAIIDLNTFLHQVKGNRDELIAYLQTHFDVYEVYGRSQWGEVLMTGYYEPVIKGYRRPQGNYQQPLYRTPTDLVNIRWDLFKSSQLPNQLPLEGMITLRGRLVDVKQGKADKKTRLGPAEVVPYPARNEIDGQGVLRHRGWEICFVDRIDAFFLQIQGSGRIDLDDGTSLFLTYANQNGHPYYPIGKDLKDVLPIEEMSMDRIKSYLRTLSIQDQEVILNRNPSYIFFQTSPLKRGITFQGTPVVGERTIATDRNLFPKGAMALLEFSPPDEDIKKSPKKIQKIVFDQDTGGAIRGPGRVDYFWGLGEEAGEKAGRMNGLGKLFYLVPKKRTASHP